MSFVPFSVVEDSLDHLCVKNVPFFLSFLAARRLLNKSFCVSGIPVLLWSLLPTNRLAKYRKKVNYTTTETRHQPYGHTTSSQIHGYSPDFCLQKNLFQEQHKLQPAKPQESSSYTSALPYNESPNAHNTQKRKVSSETSNRSKKHRKTRGVPQNYVYSIQQQGFPQPLFCPDMYCLVNGDPQSSTAIGGYNDDQFHC